jgi:hypothetical protein
MSFPPHDIFVFAVLICGIVANLLVRIYYALKENQ